LTDVGAFLALGADAGVVEVGAEVVEAGVGVGRRCQTVIRIERPTATMSFFLPRRRAMRR
jgi:hypothetical protein